MLPTLHNNMYVAGVLLHLPHRAILNAGFAPQGELVLLGSLNVYIVQVCIIMKSDAPCS